LRFTLAAIAAKRNILVALLSSVTHFIADRRKHSHSARGQRARAVEFDDA
jgi:hypothetical protein